MITILLIFVIATCLIGFCFVKVDKRNTLNRSVDSDKVPILRGTSGERRFIASLIDHGVNESDIYHDLIIKNDNKLSQIDVVIMIPAGIIVVEHKDYHGEITLSEVPDTWEEITINDVYPIENPILQNESHIKSIVETAASQYGLNNMKGVLIYSLIVFGDNAKISDDLADYVSVTNGMYKFVENETEAVDRVVRLYQNIEYTSIKKEGLRPLLADAVINGGKPEYKLEHLRQVRGYL